MSWSILRRWIAPEDCVPSETAVFSGAVFVCGLDRIENGCQTLFETENESGGES